ncbi:MAG: hypothetical protein ACPG5U_06105, partial [Planktomarina sp.]
MRFLILAGIVGLAGCTLQAPTQSTTPAAQTKASVSAPTPAAAPGNRLTERQAARQFVRVVEKMEPVLEK